MLELIADAERQGAQAFPALPADGSPRSDASQRSWLPTILTGVTSDMRIDSEEVFGPI